MHPNLENSTACFKSMPNFNAHGCFITFVVGLLWAPVWQALFWVCQRIPLINLMDWPVMVVLSGTSNSIVEG